MIDPRFDGVAVLWFADSRGNTGPGPPKRGKDPGFLVALMAGTNIMEENPGTGFLVEETDGILSVAQDPMRKRGPLAAEA